MDEHSQYLNHLAEAAKSGDPKALAELSSIALGGNRDAQLAVQAIDKQGQHLTTEKSGAVKSMVWPREVEEGERGPRLGDIPLHNDL